MIMFKYDYRILHIMGSRRIPSIVKRADRVAKSYITKSNCRVSMYAEIARGGNVIARGYNKKTFQGSIHAEVDAISKLLRQKRGADGATITVIRYLKNDSFGMSKPCPKCKKAIIKAGIKRINYFDYDGNFHSERL